MTHIPDCVAYRHEAKPTSHTHNENGEIALRLMPKFRIMLGSALALFVPMHCVSAAEIQLMCAGGSILVFVNPSTNTVTYKTSDDTMTFVDGADLDNMIGDTFGGATPCHYIGKISVKITPDEITFGGHATNVNMCYERRSNRVFAAYGNKEKDEFTINRVTGDADLDGRRVSCEKYVHRF